jgi:hypothetical protein
MVVKVEGQQSTYYVEVITGGSSSSGSSWSEITGKPTEFTPSNHTHPISDVTGLQSALDGKQVAGSYASANHAHAISDVTGLQTALDGKQASGSYANASHSHAISDVTGLQTSLDGKAAATHSHGISDVTGLQTALDGKQASGSYAAASHGHAISDVTGLQTSLDGKASSSHGHIIADVTGLQTALDGKQASLSSGTNIKTINGGSVLGSGDLVVSGAASWGGITGTLSSQTDLQSALDGKSATGHTHTAANITDFNSATDARIALQQDGNNLKAYQALGSTIKAQTVDQALAYSNVSSNLTDNQIRYTAVFLSEAATLTGVRVYVRVLGNYTGDQTNGVALYTYSGGTLTKVAESTNLSSRWTSAANAGQEIPFASTYVASAGLYYVGILYNNSAQTTAPALATGVALNNAAMAGTAFGFTNSAKLYGTVAAQNSFPATQAMSGVTASTAATWVALY